MCFDQFLEQNIKVLQNPSSGKLYCNFLGISRKEYPKWEGWKIINDYKELGVDIKDIQDETLNILVKNFYYIQYIKNLN